MSTRCGACGFAPDDYTAQDLAGTLRSMPRRLAWMLEGVPPAIAAAPEVVAATQRCRADAHDAHLGTHALHELGRLLQDRGAGPAPARGTLQQLNASPGGVPKRRVEWAVIDRRGIAGDRQASRRHHGRPWQALCLWSAEVVDALAAEGHPVVYGACGENLTLRGLDWASLRPGVRLGVGSAIVELSAYADPCKKNARWFLEGDFRRMDHARHPGFSRLYGAVEHEGEARPGDLVTVEPVFGGT